MKSVLCCIDFQEDFCNPQTGTLYVPNAEHDARRVAAMVNRMGTKFHAIVATLDSHHPLHIAHPNFWVNPRGENPQPFTPISLAEVQAGEWVAAKIGMRRRAEQYVQALETNKRYPLVIWPRHCLIGSPGHNVVPELWQAFTDWELREGATVDYVTKGSNPFTEHYSAVKADVFDPADPSTGINTNLIAILQEADEIVWTGEAGSHCLLNTVVDVATEFGDDSYLKKFVLLTDGTSPVVSPFVDFPKLQADFIRDFTARGMRVSTTTDYLA